MVISQATERLPFSLRVEEEGLGRFLTTNEELATLQLNITKNCNLTCKHCHVGSGPARTEEMDRKTLQACLDVFEAGPFTSLDITGGAPELNSHYRWLLDEAARLAADKRAAGLSPNIITRSNAAILTLPEFEDLPEFWAKLGIEVAVSLPHYEEGKTNRMRGEGVFEQIIAGLHALNAAGYGKDTGNLVLYIVVNPGGAILPGAQASIELEYRKELGARYGITFSNLLVITNNPVGRFEEFLESRNLLDAYMDKLYNAFNPATVEAAMCRDQISVDVDGRIFDCDFNQIVDLPILETCKDDGYLPVNKEGNPARALTVFDVARDGISIACPRSMRVDNHCYACTAGAGSSCGGATAE